MTIHRSLNHWVLAISVGLASAMALTPNIGLADEIKNKALASSYPEPNAALRKVLKEATGRTATPTAEQRSNGLPAK